MMGARNLTIALGGEWRGSYGTAPCPVCQTERRADQCALTLSDGHTGLLANCKKSGCAFRYIVAALGINRSTLARPDPAILAQRAAERRAAAKRPSDAAHKLWRESLTISGTPAEAYLRSRGITCPLSDALRFHQACWHGATRQPLPAMVALVEGAPDFALHRTYLESDGSGKAKVEPAKAMLGGVMGGAVRLADAPGRLVVAEGIETALSLAGGFLRAPATIWAALSTSGMRGLTLPDVPGRLTIAADGDPAGKAAAHDLAVRAKAEGWNVGILPAPDGQDWNDVLTARGAIG